MLYGLPYLERSSDLSTMEANDHFLKNYILGHSSTLLFIRLQGLLIQTPPLEFPAHSYRPGDYVLMKTWKESKLNPIRKGHDQVLLKTETALQAAKRGWTHATRAKNSPDPHQG
jgi:hypothetical protein